jgi:hypothetical protein
MSMSAKEDAHLAEQARDKDATARKQKTEARNPKSQTPPVRTADIIQRAVLDSGSLNARDVLQLQSAIGNRAVGRLLGKVTARRESDGRSERAQISTPAQESLRRVPDGRPGLPVQAKLAVNEPGDRYEHEADRVARRVVDTINSAPAETAPTGARRQEVNVAPSSQQPDIQRLESSGVSVVGANLEGAVQQVRGGGGQSIADNIRRPMERAFGADFSAVRVHADARADALSRSIRATAFTTGRDVFFRQGAYAPGSRGGQELLAHELTHVVQQGGQAGTRGQQVGAQGAIQRRVDNLNLVPETEDTILQVLEDEGLTKVYKLPKEFDKNPRKGSTVLDRAKSASARLSAQSSTKRGTQTGDYKDIGALGRWERLATTHELAEKTLDTGHLIADEFFDDNQKAFAYEANNLAPQNVIFNERAYRKLVEKPVGANLSNGDVTLEVELEYDNDPLTLSVEVLAARHALEVLDQTEHQKLVKLDKTLDVPRRLPTDWKTTVKPVVKPLAKGSKKPKKPVKPINLTQAPSVTTTTYQPTDPNRTFFTQAVPFTVNEVKNTTSIQEFEFQQGHTFEDPLAIRNPIKIAADPQSGRYTPRQTERARKRVSQSMKYKVIDKTAEIVEDITKKNKKRKVEGNDLNLRVMQKVRAAPSGTLVTDLIDDILIEVQQVGYDKKEQKRFENAMEDIYSDDEDPKTEQL